MNIFEKKVKPTYLLELNDEELQVLADSLRIMTGNAKKIAEDANFAQVLTEMRNKLKLFNEYRTQT